MDHGKHIEVLISGDKMSAYVAIGDGDWSLNKIRQSLNAEGITFGISDAAIRTCISGKRHTPYQVAWGLPPHHGVSGPAGNRPRLVFKFGHSRGKPPGVLKTSPNFRKQWRSILSSGSVRAGTILAFVRNLEGCSFGITVTGEKVPYFDNQPVLKCGPNTILSRDGKYVIAQKSGIPYVDNNGPEVLGQITIDGNIGPLTGDITFPGDLMIQGDVLQGFRVSSWGSLIITGNLYGSASCADNIMVKGGINAPGEIVESGGSISAKFCENSAIRAFGDVVVSEAIMHSVVETEQQLVVSQERGRIVGGMAVSRLGVSTYAAGSPMGIATLFKIGVSPKIRRKHERLQREITLVQAEIQKSKRAGLRPAGSGRPQFDNIRLQRMISHYEDKEKGLKEHLLSVEDLISKSEQGYFCAKRVLPGTKVFIGLKETYFAFSEHQVSIGVKRDEAD